MKLKESDFESEVIGAEKEMNFEIDTSSSVIFDILRDKMYTNKIAAVCREVASNSRDANVEADCKEVPIRISIVEPFELDCISDKSIVFGDCGLGITPNRMADVFVKYAASTKRSTNSQVGGFGLGAKTPFAYSDTFTVITVCDLPALKEYSRGGSERDIPSKRMRYVYTAMIDDTQKGKMILFESDESDEPTGTQIVVPFNDNDRQDFEKEVHRATCLWSVKPELKGFQYAYDAIDKLMDEDGFVVLDDENEFFYSTFLAIIEGIPYKLDTGIFSQQFGDILKYGLGERNPIALYFGTGELSITANREGIEYTDETKEVIVKKLEHIVAKIEEKLINYIKVDDNYLESCIRLNEMKDSRRY